jgi:branched-chain amino acid transport system ATP-binding protein
LERKTTLLRVKNINVHYGVIPALRDFSLTIEEGQIVALAGANGAGKTTALKAIMGILSQRGGEIIYKDRNITNLSADRRVEMGMAMVPEGRQIFARLTVRDNMDLGAYHRKDRNGVKRDLDWVYDLFPVLKEREGQIAGTLSGGEQQMLALGRGLMSHPRLLLLDEPSLGLAPLVVRDIYRVIREINRSGITMLLVEQNINMAMKVSSYAYILETGQIRSEGAPHEVMRKENIMKAYLGE